ncbi:MAG TPA: YfhO family protein, partial [Saprospiraceae bacterium]
AFAGNYYKGALSLFIPFSFLFVGLLGFQEIISGKPLNKWVLFLSSLLWLCLLWYPYNTPDVIISTAMQLKVSVFILGYTALLWMFSEGMLKKAVYPMLVSVVSIEALLLAWPAINDRTALLKTDITDKKYHFDYSGDAVKRIEELDPASFYRIDKVYGSIKTGYNDGMVQGFFGSKTYQSHNHKGYVEFLDKAGVIDASKEQNTRWLVGVSATGILHGLFSIKYLLSNAASQEKVDPAIYTAIDTVGNVTISSNNYYIPFGIPMESYLSESAFEKLPINQRRRAFYFAAVGEDNASWKSRLTPLATDTISFFGTATRDRTQALAGKAMVMDHFSQKRIKGHIEPEQPVMLFFSIPYDGGWQATVDGKPQEVHKVNYGFTGVVVDSGKHAIELRYEPPMSKTGWIGVLVGLLFAGILYRFRKNF